MTPAAVLGAVLTPTLTLVGVMVTALLSRRASRETSSIDALRAVAAETRAAADQVRAERDEAYLRIRVLSAYLRRVIGEARRAGAALPDPPDELTWNSWR